MVYPGTEPFALRHGAQDIGLSQMAAQLASICNCYKKRSCLRMSPEG